MEIMLSAKSPFARFGIHVAFASRHALRRAYHHGALVVHYDKNTDVRATTACKILCSVRDTSAPSCHPQPLLLTPVHRRLRYHCPMWPGKPLRLPRLAECWRKSGPGCAVASRRNANQLPLACGACHGALACGALAGTAVQQAGVQIPCGALAGTAVQQAGVQIPLHRLPDKSPLKSPLLICGHRIARVAGSDRKKCGARKASALGVRRCGGAWGEVTIALHKKLYGVFQFWVSAEPGPGPAGFREDGSEHVCHMRYGQHLGGSALARPSMYAYGSFALR